MMEVVGVEPMTIERQQRQCEEAPHSRKDSARKPHADKIMNKTTRKNQINNHFDMYMYIPVANRWNPCRFEQGWASLFCKPSTLNSPTSPQPHYYKLWSTNTSLIISYKDHSEHRNCRGKEQKKWWRRLGWNSWPLSRSSKDSARVIIGGAEE